MEPGLRLALARNAHRYVMMFFWPRGQRAYRECVVKPDIHPKYEEVEVRCACGNTFKTRSTKPELHLEICSNCHPFFTGKQKLIDTEGRVERFTKRFGTQNAETRKKAAADLKAKKAAPKKKPARA